jgi:hypothetical protein
MPRAELDPSIQIFEASKTTRSLFLYSANSKLQHNSFGNFISCPAKLNLSRRWVSSETTFLPEDSCRLGFCAVEIDRRFTDVYCFHQGDGAESPLKRRSVSIRLQNVTSQKTSLQLSPWELEISLSCLSVSVLAKITWNIVRKMICNFGLNFYSSLYLNASSDLTSSN